MIIRNFQIIDKGFLKARFDVFLPTLGMTIRDVLLMQKGEAKWTNFPSKTYEKDGKEKRVPMIFLEPERKRSFNEKCLEKIKNKDFESPDLKESDSFRPQEK